MSLSDITVFRDFQTIDGFVQVPPNREGEKTETTVDEFLTAVSGSFEERLPHPKTNPNTGAKFGAHTWVRVPTSAVNSPTFTLP